MTDHLSKTKRSWNMSRIRSKDTKPELEVRKYLFSKGFRYRLHCSSLPGKPDIANQRRKIAVFVNGCFWHQHKGCRRASVPKSNKDYWIPKLKNNISRFNKNCLDMQHAGWHVFTVWECEAADKKILNRVCNKIMTIHE